VDPRAGLDDLEKILDPAGTRSPTHRVIQLVGVAIPTELSRLSVVIYATKSNCVELDTVWRLPHETIGLFGLMTVAIVKL
jgi:hypothetical protein